MRRNTFNHQEIDLIKHRSNTLVTYADDTILLEKSSYDIEDNVIRLITHPFTILGFIVNETKT